MGTIVEKSEYLTETKEKIKESINNIGGDITSETTFREYAQELDNIYDNLPKTTGEDTNISLNTIKGKMSLGLKGDTSQDTTQGNQLLDIANLVNSGTSTTHTFTNNILTITNTSGTYNNAQAELVNLIKANPNKVLKFTYSAIDVTNAKTNSNESNIIQIKVVNGGSTTYNALIRKDLLNLTYTIPSDTSNITSALLTISSNNTNTSQAGEIIVTKPMLQFGTTAHDYEQYTGGTASPNPTYPQNIEVVTGTQEVKVSNKNLLGEIEQGGINSRGNPTTSTTRVRSKDFINVQSSTNYVISGSGANVIILQYEENETYIGQTYSSWKTLPYAFTTASNCKKIKTLFGDGTNTLTPSDITNAQLEKGSTATTYTPHQEQTQIVSLGDIELCKIGNYQDYLYKSNDKWYKKEYIDKAVLNGSENWQYDSTNQRYYNPTLIASNVVTPPNNNTKAEALSNIGIITANETIYTSGKNGIAIHPNGSIYITKSVYDNISTTNVVLYYVYETYEDIQITNTTLIEQLDNLEKLKSYNGVTNINCSGNLSAILGVSALKGE